MKFKLVKINEGGQVTIMDEKKEINNSMYTAEECILGDEVCRLINADKELKVFFREKLADTLQTYAVEVTTAYQTKDKQRAADATCKAAELFKALIMHIYLKVVPKREAEQREKEAKK